MTIIDESLAVKLGANGPSRTLNFKWVDSKDRRIDSKLIDLKVRGATDSQFFQLKDVRTMKKLELPVQTVHTKDLVKRWSHLSKVKLPNMTEAQPKLLIGQDNADLIVSQEVIKGPSNSPVLSRTRLGWVIHGDARGFKGATGKNFVCHLTHGDEEADELHRLVLDSFKIDALGVRLDTKTIRSKEEVRAQDIMDKTIRRVGDRWEAGLLWREDEKKLPESRNMAMKRLLYLESKLRKNEDFAREYVGKIRDYEAKGYARKLSAEEAKIETPTTWYLPHFGTWNPNKERKLRLVFDAAARSGGRSLNDFLLPGPDLLKSLPGTLFKFRRDKIGICGDIREMFHQVLVRKEDRSSQRFLWRELEFDREPSVYEMRVLIFGATCSPCISQEVKNRNAKDSTDDPEIVKAIVDRHYVDDYLDSVATEDEAIRRIKDVMTIHKAGGFEIRNWTSNSKLVNDSLDPDLRTKCQRNILSKLTADSEKILGLTWEPTSDRFTFNCSIERLKKEIFTKMQQRRPTKREVLRMLMLLYDPLGFLSSLTVRAKIIIQEIWKSGLGWDDALTESLDLKWRKWLQGLTEAAKFSIPRCYTPFDDNNKTFQLHVFCDASEKAFSAVAYLRAEGDHRVQVSLVMAKTRVSPLKSVSIPRLELQAALMGCRMGNFIVSEHEEDIREVYYWSDSTTVLHWIKSDSGIYKQFVANRIGEIQDLSGPGTTWRWIPTDENVADDATRDSGSWTCDENNRWMTGPSFLRYPENLWPGGQLLETTRTDDDSEKKREFAGLTTENEEFDFFSFLWSKFSTWTRLTRVTAWIKRYLNNCQAAAKKNEGRKGCLTVAECDEAEKTLFSAAQKKSFPAEFRCLKKEKPMPSNSRLLQLNPRLDEDDVMRVHGRLEFANDMEESAKHPIILEPKHALTRLVVDHFHVAANHHGQGMVVNELRQRFWILKVKTAVRSSWNSCNYCKIRRAQPKPVMMGQLPEARLATFKRPFTITGMDYFGPMLVAIGRRQEKRYGVLFTCLTTRAVHVELASSLNTDSAIMAIRRMAARRSQPREIYSDNGTNFVGADAELRRALKELDQTMIEEELAKRKIQWHFNPPGAPHMGGCWERLVRSIKTALKVTLKERVPREEVLKTLLTEAESIVNSRPLTDTAISAEDPECLTPNHFLIGTSSAGQVPGNFTDTDLTLRKQWRISQRLADLFWQRWVKEYRPTLLKRPKWFKEGEDIKVDDIVVVVDESLHREEWPIGRITKTYPGRDGCVRVVDVKSKFGTFRRPITKVAVIKIRSEEREN